MKKLFPREILWMILPVALLVGLGSLMKSQLIGRRSLSITSGAIQWLPPTYGALIGKQNAKGLTVSAVVRVSTPWMQSRPTGLPTFTGVDVIDERGRSLKYLFKSLDISPRSSTLPNTRVDPEGNSISPFFISVPEVSLPTSVRSATYECDVHWGSAPPVHFSVKIPFPWIQRSATQLGLKSVRWKPHLRGSGGTVEVICQSASPLPLVVLGAVPAKLQLSASPKAKRWDMNGTQYTADMVEFIDPPNAKAVIAEWSQRIESGDGKLNSLNATAQYHAAQSANALAPKLLPPYIVMSNGLGQNGTVHLTYDISGIPAIYKNPVFRCEIYLVGDGMVSVKCPLK